MLECSHCNSEFAVESIEDLELSGNQLNAKCSECGQRSWVKFDKLAEELDMSVEEVKEYRDELKAEKVEEEVEEEKGGGTKSDKYIPPEQQMIEEMAEILEEQLPRVPGISEEKAQVILEEFKDDQVLQNDDLKFWNFIKDISPKANDRMLNRVLDRAFRARDQYDVESGGRRRELRGSERTGRRREIDLVDLPPEIREMFEEKRRKKEIEKKRKELGIDRIEQQIAKLTKAVSGGGGSKGDSGGKNTKEELIMDGLKMRAIQEMRKQGEGVGGNPLSEMYSTAGEVAGKAIDKVDNIAPALISFMEMMKSKDRAVNALIAKEIGLDPGELLTEREGIPWDAIQEKRKGSEKVEEEAEKRETAEKEEKKGPPRGNEGATK